MAITFLAFQKPTNSFFFFFFFFEPKLSGDWRHVSHCHQPNRFFGRYWPKLPRVGNGQFVLNKQNSQFPMPKIKKWGPNSLAIPLLLVLSISRPFLWLWDSLFQRNMSIGFFFFFLERKYAWNYGILSLLIFSFKKEKKKKGCASFDLLQVGGCWIKGHVTSSDLILADRSFGWHLVKNSCPCEGCNGD